MQINKPSMHLSNIKYRPDIDGLRAFAVLLVVAFHAFPAIFKGGFAGVDVFFVISGFLISTIIFENLDREDFSFSDFYSRRIQRIFPALLIVLFTCGVFGWFALLSNEYKLLGKHIFAGSGFVSNFILWSEAGYFDASAETKPLLHLWSLGIEEQFYIVWPFLLWLAWKRKFNLLTIIIVLTVISFYLNIKEIKKDSIAAFYSPLSRFWELLCGSVLAWFALYKKSFFKKYILKIDGFLIYLIYQEKKLKDGKTFLNVVSLIGFLLLVYSFWKIDKNVSFPGKWAAVPVAGTILLISAGADSWVNKYILSNRIVVWIGLISFPLYLWHWPLLSFASIIEEGTPSRSIRIAAILLSIALAWATYRFVERPMRFFGVRKIKVIILIFLMTVVGSLGYLIFLNNGFKYRFESNKSELYELIRDPLPEVEDFECGEIIEIFSAFDFNGGCRLSKNQDPSILFVGDSHAAHYKNAVWDKFADESVLMLVQTSCLPFSSNHFMIGDCKEKYSSIIKYIESNKSIKKVILSGYWSYLISGGFNQEGKNWRLARIPTEEQISSFKYNAEEFISRVLIAGKDIIYIQDIPDLDFNIHSCFYLRPLRITQPNLRENCWIDEDEFNKRISFYDNIVDDVLGKFSTVKIFKTRKYLCSEGKCSASDEFFPYYYNGDHVNRHGAKIIINGLFEEYF